MSYDRDEPTTQRPDVTGCWVAFNYDGSAFVPFATEIEAYRYAAGFHMNVKFAAYGDSDWMRTKP